MLLWSLRFRSRDGGFYWHSEPANEGRYKAFHWPGFPSGDAYEERALLALVHDLGHRIRNLEPPAEPVPATPVMLPTSDPAAISWRGSVGATHYVLERASDASGPWLTIAADAREDRTQYRPLYSDETAVDGESWRYRVSAANASGTSSASTPAGPVRAVARVFVDELEDLSRMAAYSAGVEIVTAHARPTREDASRVGMEPGATVTYRTAGPIAAVRVLAFADDETAEIAVSVGGGSAGDGGVACRRTIMGGGGGDYGYLVPIEFEASITDSDADVVTLTAGSRRLQISRVELRYRRGAAR